MDGHCDSMKESAKGRFFENMLGIIQKKMKPNENWRKSSLGLLQTMTALLPKLKNVTLVCDDSLNIQPHKVIL